MPIERQSDDEGGGSYVPQMAMLRFEHFRGVNTSTTRYGVPEQQAYWLNGFMPLDAFNCRTLYGIGFPFSYAASPNTIVQFGFGNIGSIFYLIAFISDGSIVAININTGIASTIAPAGTVTGSITQNTCGMTNWASQYIIIVWAQGGYAVWDGNAFYGPGSVAPPVTILDVGGSYSGTPSVTFVGGGGTGAAATAIMSGGSVISISITNGGSGYTSVPIINVVGGGVTVAAASASLAAARPAPTSVGSVSVTYSGTGYTGVPAVSFVGGGGTGASAFAVMYSSGPPYSVSLVSLLSGGNNYITPPTVVFTGGGPAEATVGIVPTGIGGTRAEIYDQRVWVIGSNRVAFTAAGSPLDFASSDGGGSFASNDSFLQVRFANLKQTNGFLYLIGDSSVNYISNVVTSGNPLATTFTNQNADPQVGTPFPSTVGLFGRNFIFANSFGVHVGYGAAITKVSKSLDGVWNTVANFSGLLLSSANATIFGRRVWMVLVPIIDPVTGIQTTELLMWDGEVWWASTQEQPLIFINSQENNSTFTAYGTDGNQIWPLFQFPSTGFTKTAQSKLWGVPIGYHESKTTSRFWGLTKYYGTYSAPTLTIESESGTYSFVPTGASNNLVTVFKPQAIGNNGACLGMTFVTTASDMALISLEIDAIPLAYRG